MLKIWTNSDSFELPRLPGLTAEQTDCTIQDSDDPDLTEYCFQYDLWDKATENLIEGDLSSSAELALNMSPDILRWDFSQ